MKNDRDPTQGTNHSFFPRGIFPWLAGFALVWAVMALIGSRRTPSKPAALPADVHSVTESPVKDANVHYLQYPIEKTVVALKDAQTTLGSARPDIQATKVAINQAQQAVAELTDYYLPLTEARDHLVRAYWEHLAGQNDLRDVDLAAASNQLAWIVENSSVLMGNDAEELLTILNSLELHKQKDQMFVEDLRNLCEKVQMHLVHASLKLEKPDKTGDTIPAPEPVAPNG